MKPRHGGGATHIWTSTDGAFTKSFQKIGLDIAPDPYPGLVILADKNLSNARLYVVKDCMREIDQLIAGFKCCTHMYWYLEKDQTQRNVMLSQLTNHPVFIG